jgi:hypothetical protein
MDKIKTNNEYINQHKLGVEIDQPSAHTQQKQVLKKIYNKQNIIMKMRDKIKLKTKENKREREEIASEREINIP